MEISAMVLADNISLDGTRLTTLELHYHRYILPEFNTHRAFSRNGASSRAIPTAKLIEQCIIERVEPLEWGLNQAGMQAFTIADDKLRQEGQRIWDEARWDAIKHARRLFEKGFAKQIVNRVLEPYLSTRTVVTSTDWANFEALRNHKDAQPEIRDLAVKIILARKASTPKLLALGEWHLPYILPGDDHRAKEWLLNNRGSLNDLRDLFDGSSLWFSSDVDLVLCMVSAARCARVSYRTVEGTATDFSKDLELFQRLVKTQPVHASPTEHQATPFNTPHLTANFRNFVQFRRLIKGETVHDA